MIGLHHMSYSPAAQAHQQELNSLKRLVATGKPARVKSSAAATAATAVVATSKTGRRQTDQEATQYQQQFLQEDLHNNHLQGQRFIRVLPKTADQMVSSVPKCKSGKSRQNPSNTFGRASSSGAFQMANNFINYNQQPQHQHQMNQATSQLSDSSGRQHENQVLLIVQDDHAKGGGFPVIGRRLPDKSWPASGSGGGGGQSQPRQQVAGLDLSICTAMQPQPVVGRRSHRQKQLQQELPMNATSMQHFQVQLSETPKKTKVIKQSNSKSTTTKQSRPLRQQQPFGPSSSSCSTLHCQTSCLSAASSPSMATTATASSWPQETSQDMDLRLNYDDHNDNSYVCLESCCRPPTGECPLECCRQPPAATAKTKAAARRPSTSKSKSMRDLHHLTCQTGGLQGSPMDALQSVEQLSGQLSSKLAFVSSSYHHHHHQQARSSLSSSSLMSSASTATTTTTSCHPTNASPLHLNGSASSRQQVNQHNHHPQQRAQRPNPNLNTNRYHQQQHHHSRQHPANNHQSQPQLVPPPVPEKPKQGYTLMANQLPIQIPANGQHQLELQLQLDLKRHQHHQPKHRRSSVGGHNHLAVGGRPGQAANNNTHHDYHHHYYHHNHNQNSREEDEQRQLKAKHQVTQMYESLASELKAKLSDPKAAPILLPPKDYDTLSRRQGSLTGIESRRSTNPQLVGPTTSSSFKLLHHYHQAEEAAADADAGHGQTDEASKSDEPIHRSRSNSSSGLGSISLAGSSSPNDTINCSRSPSSSSSTSSSSSSSSAGHEGSCEAIDSRLAARHDQRGKGIENHNPSKVSDGILWNGRVEIPLKVNASQRNGNTYLATKQIIY